MDDNILEVKDFEHFLMNRIKVEAHNLSDLQSTTHLVGFVQRKGCEYSVQDTNVSTLPLFMSLDTLHVLQLVS